VRDFSAQLTTGNLKASIQPLKTLEERGTVLNTWTDGSYRTCAGAGWIITYDNRGAASDDSDTMVHPGSVNIGPTQTAFDAEVAVIERAMRWLAGHHVVGLQHVTVHSDSTSAIVRCQYVGASPEQSQASRIAHHADRLLSDGVTANI
jgi:hypothetical protein